MPLPSLTFTEEDNQLGTIPPNDGDTLAIIATCEKGPINEPGIYLNPKDIQSTFGRGLLAELACWEVATTGRPVLLVREDTVTQGSAGSLVTSGVTGSCVVTLDTAVKPFDDYQVVVLIVAEGTIGTAGITYKYSLDGGITYSRETALGTAATFTIADANVKFNLAAGDLNADDTWSAIAVAPAGDDNTLDDALESLQNTANKFDLIVREGPSTAASVAVLETRCVSMSDLGREMTAIASFRWKNAGETEQQYADAFNAAFAATVAPHCSVWTDAVDVQSPISQRWYKRRTGFDACVAAVDANPGQDLAEQGTQVRPDGVRLVDQNNNPKYHNELLSPTLDGLRASTYRTWIGYPGAYIGNARLMSTPGSDFQYLQHRRVMNLAKQVTRRVLTRYSSADLLANATNGLIDEGDALDIESNVNNELEEELVKTRNASGATYTVNRGDNLISTSKLKGPLRVIPLIYVKDIDVTASFFNPALTANAGIGIEG
jgi:hypothetical protein